MNMECKCPFDILVSFPLNIYLNVGFLDCIVTVKILLSGPPMKKKKKKEKKKSKCVKQGDGKKKELCCQ
jgi:hypothetical protein